MYLYKLISIVILVTALFSCDSGPKVIEAEPTAVDHTGAGSVSNDAPGAQGIAVSDEHKVVVEEVLNTTKYTYLNVTENDNKFWIAIPKKEVEIGETYYYKGGLLKKNFESKEHNRVFETVYLVSDIRKQPIAAGGSAVDQALNQLQGGNAAADDRPINVKPAAGAITLADLFSNKEKYNGKLVKVTGKCVKVNPNIMGRNWIHVQDGSGDDLDLTVTTAENIPMGHVVTLEGTIALNKDFGAGYRYDIIMEGAVLK